MNIAKPVIKKIPGEIIPQSKKSRQGYIDDLRNKQKFELQELLERQDKLLANKNFVSKLPDKGERILNFKEKIVQELLHRTTVEDAAKLLSKLNIASEGKAAMSQLEWTGKHVESLNGETEKIVKLDSDDEEDPLKILAQPTGSGVHKKKIIRFVPKETLIEPEDLKDIELLKTENSPELGHVKYIVNKVENPISEKKKESFKPYKTTKSNVHDPDKEKERDKKKSQHWEVTSATPPTIIHGAVKTLDINESLKLQKDQAAKLKEIQTKRAAERLAQQLGLHKIGKKPNNVGSYRLQKDNSDLSSSDEEKEEDEDCQVYDEEDNDEAGTVTYTIDTVES